MKGCKSHEANKRNNGPIMLLLCSMAPQLSVRTMIPILIATIGWFLRQQSNFHTSSNTSWLVSAGFFDSTPLSSSYYSSRHDEIRKEEELKELERGKYISDEITAEELYQAYLDIKNDYQQKAFNNNSNSNKWKVLKKTNDGIEISMLTHPSDPSCPYVRMSAVMPGSVQHVWDFLALENWEQTMPYMDPFYEGLDIYQTYNYHPTTTTTTTNNRRYSFGPIHHSKQKKQVEMILARKRTKRLLTFGKRDFTFLSVSDVPQQQHKSNHPLWVSGTLSVIAPKLFPRYPGYTRAFQDSIAFYEPYNNDSNKEEQQTALTIVCRIDLNDNTKDGQGGSIPMWIYVKTIGNTGVLSIQNMRKQLQLLPKKTTASPPLTTTKKEEIIQTHTSPSSNPIKRGWNRLFQMRSHKTS